jgi:2-amino-4-hydroxy-6-hydroxymethyldihydropteridine diphosphokinase
MERIGIGFGSNLGDGRMQIEAAVNFLQDAGIQLQVLSSFHKTKPVGFSSENEFTNAVGVFYTTLLPLEILKVLMETEKLLGRERSASSGYTDRIIDMDLLFYGDKILNDSELTIPHPRMHEREFVLQPLNEVFPEWVHPQYHQTVQHMLDTLSGVNQTAS